MPKKKTDTKKKWQKAIRKEMLKATLREAQARYGTKDPAFNYRWEHVTAVVELATRLAEETGADPDIVVAAAWLHDIRKETGPRHPIEGAKFARSFLPKTDFPPQKIEAVAKAIEDHMGLWRKKPLKNLESMVLWDADKLAKIGLTAVFHGAGDVLNRNRPMTLKRLIKNGRNNQWQQRTVASMHTEPARRAAQTRLQIYNQLWDTLEQELHGADLRLPVSEEE
ncbi:MAG: HD domain-containing protein [Anaerolineales bacterium]|nr:HD domain-containing protein [Anaerolineales bacterium]